MRSILAHLLGEDPHATYQVDKYSLGHELRQKPGGQCAVPKQRVAIDEEEQKPSQCRTSPSRLYGAPQPGGGTPPAEQPAAQEPASLGCWIVPPTNYEVTGAHRQLRTDDVVPRVPQQIAASQACIGHGNTVAEYNTETFLTPFDRAQPMVATGSLINTYTGEVTSTFEDAMPPPDRVPGDTRRERKSSQLRLLAAEGNAPTGRRKREQEDPLQAGDAGNVLPAASFRIDADVQMERAERHNRDLYFNRNELAPTELQQTRNPFAFDGYNNRLRIQPFMPVTQELDTKQWIPNATLLPGSALPQRAATRLSADSGPGRAGPAGCDVHPEPAQIMSTIRPGNTNRNFDEKALGLGVASQLYGSSVPQSVELPGQHRPQSHRTETQTMNEGPICATAESILGTLRGLSVAKPAVNPSAPESSAAPIIASGDLGLDALALPRIHGTAQSVAGSAVAAGEQGSNATDGVAAPVRGPESGISASAASSGGERTSRPQQGGEDILKRQKVEVLPQASSAVQARASRISAAKSALSRARHRPGPPAGAACALGSSARADMRPEWLQAATTSRLYGQAHATAALPGTGEVRASTTGRGDRQGLREGRIDPETAWRAQASHCAAADLRHDAALEASPTRPDHLYGAAAPATAATILAQEGSAQATFGTQTDTCLTRAGPAPGLHLSAESQLQTARPLLQTLQSAHPTCVTAISLQEDTAPTSRAPCTDGGSFSAVQSGAVEVTTQREAVNNRQEACAEYSPLGAPVPGAVTTARLSSMPRAALNAVVDVPGGQRQAMVAEVELLPMNVHCSEELSWRGGAADLGRRKDPTSFFVRDLRGVNETYRQIYALVGGDAESDPFRRFDPGMREWRQELLVEPLADRADQKLEERGSLGRLKTPTKREMRVVRSPKPAWLLRSGLHGGLTEEITTRCEEVVE